MKINSFLKVLVVQLTLVSTFFGSVSANYQEEAYSPTPECAVEYREVREIRIGQQLFWDATRSSRINGPITRDNAIVSLDHFISLFDRSCDYNVIRVNNYLEQAKDPHRAKKAFRRMILARRVLLSVYKRAAYLRQHQILFTMSSEASGSQIIVDFEKLILENLCLDDFVGDDRELLQSLIQRDQANRELFETRLCEMFKFLHTELNFEIPSEDARIEFLSDDDDTFASILVAMSLLYSIMSNVPLGRSGNLMLSHVETYRVQVPTLVWCRYLDLF